MTDQTRPQNRQAKKPESPFNSNLASTLKGCENKANKAKNAMSEKEQGQKAKLGYTERLLTKKELRDLLNLPSTRSIDELVRRRVISSVRLGHRTVRFDPIAVYSDLDRMTLRAVN